MRLTLIPGLIAGTMLAAAGVLPVAAEPVATGDKIRDRILSRIERGRLMRAPSITGGRTAPGGGLGYESVVVGGQIRLFVRYTPNRLLVSAKPAPVVFMLHANGVRADQTAAQLGLNRLADTEGFIAVYPQAGGERWNSGKDAEPDDVEFLNRLADAMVAQTNADPKRIYLAGVGAGGGMAVRLACGDGSRFSAYGLIGAAIREIEDCRLQPPKLAIVNGTAVDEPGAVTGVLAGKGGDPLGAVAGRLGCTALTQATQSGKVARSKWSGCNSGVEIEVLRSLDRMAAERAVLELWAFFRRVVP